MRLATVPTWVLLPDMQWHEVESWAQEALKSARIRNDGDLDPIETAKLRGRMLTLKELIALPDRVKTMEAQSNDAGPL